MLRSALCFTGGPYADTRGTPPEQDAESWIRKPHLQIPGADADLKKTQPAESAMESEQPPRGNVLLTNNIFYR